MKEWKSPIPKKVHLIWIGKRDPPDYFTKYFFKSFQKYMSDFEIRIWSNSDLNKKNFPLTWKYIQKAKKFHGKQMEDEDGNKMYDKDYNPLTHNKYAQITDLMRLEIVYREGGFYFDTTFEILKSMYDLLNKKNKKFIGCNEIPRFKDVYDLSNSFFGATKNNVILKRLLSKKKLDSIDFWSDQIAIETGPSYLRSGIYNNDSILIFPSKYFYPFIEPFDHETKNPPYRKSSKNKCHSKKGKKRTKRLQNKKGYIEYPCKKYPKSYALKHWQLGKSWLIDEYYT